MEEVLARARRVAEEAEVFTVTSEETPIQFEANRLKHAQRRQSTSVALRLIKQDRLGYATATNLDDIAGLVDMAAETARFGMEAKFEFPSSADYPTVELFDDAAETVPIETMVKLGAEMIGRIRSDTPDLICESWVSHGTSTMRILNSRGGQATYRQTHFSLGVYGTLVRGTDMLFVGEGDTSCHPLLESGTVSKRVLEQLARARKMASVGTGTMPAVFTPNGVAGALVAPFVSAFNGKSVLEGASPLAKRLGEAVFDPAFSLRDDPTLAFRPSSRPCDDEGVPSQVTPLVERGVVKSFLYDLQTAGLAGTRSSGSGSRGRGLPGPAPSAFIISPGTVTFDQMLADMKDGLVIEELMGAEQGNVLGGDFGGNVLLGYRVENGRIVGRVKNTMVSGNIYQLFKKIAAIGSDARWVSGFVSTPSLYFPGIAVASK